MVFVENQSTAKENNSKLTNDDEWTSKDNIIIWLLAFLVVGALNVCLNLATILTFTKNRHLRRRSVYCLINLAVADMMYGGSGTVYIFCIFVEQYLKLEIDFRIKLVVYILSILAFIAALLSLALISLERVYATVFPLRHRAAPERKYSVAFTILWLLALAVSLLFNLTPRSQFQAVFICFWVILIVSLVTMFVSYIIIFIKVRLQDKELHRQQSRSAMQSWTQRRERDLAVTLFIVTVLSLLTWLPYLTVRVLYLRQQNSFDLSKSLPSMVSIVFLIQWLNSLVNPAIYVYRMRDFRKAFFQLVCRCAHDRQNVHPIGNQGENIGIVLSARQN